MMFAQANSEHCRHKIFNAEFTIDGVAQDKSLFGMIRNTHQLAPQHTVVAYSDNASIMEGHQVSGLWMEMASGADGSSASSYQKVASTSHVLMKVETHNHPTAISHSPAHPPAQAANPRRRRHRPAPSPRRASRVHRVQALGQHRGQA